MDVLRLDAADGYKPLCQVPALVGGVRTKPTGEKGGIHPHTWTRFGHFKEASGGNCPHSHGPFVRSPIFRRVVGSSSCWGMLGSFFVVFRNALNLAFEGTSLLVLVPMAHPHGQEFLLLAAGEPPGDL